MQIWYDNLFLVKIAFKFEGKMKVFFTQIHKRLVTSKHSWKEILKIVLQIEADYHRWKFGDGRKKRASRVNICISSNKY